ELKPHGGCDFVADFGVRMPVELFLSFVELPTEDRPLVRKWVEEAARNPNREETAVSRMATFEYLSEALEKRRCNPGTDVFSRIVEAEAEGKIAPTDSV